MLYLARGVDQLRETLEAAGRFSIKLNEFKSSSFKRESPFFKRTPFAIKQIIIFQYKKHDDSIKRRHVSIEIDLFSRENHHSSREKPSFFKTKLIFFQDTLFIIHIMLLCYTFYVMKTHPFFKTQSFYAPIVHRPVPTLHALQHRGCHTNPPVLKINVLQ